MIRFIFKLLPLAFFIAAGAFLYLAVTDEEFASSLPLHSFFPSKMQNSQEDNPPSTLTVNIKKAQEKALEMIAEFERLPEKRYDPEEDQAFLKKKLTREQNKQNSEVRSAPFRGIILSSDPQATEETVEKKVIQAEPESQVHENILLLSKEDKSNEHKSVEEEKSEKTEFAEMLGRALIKLKSSAHSSQSALPQFPQSMEQPSRTAEQNLSAKESSEEPLPGYRQSFQSQETVFSVSPQPPAVPQQDLSYHQPVPPSVLQMPAQQYRPSAGGASRTSQPHLRTASLPSKGIIPPPAYRQAEPARQETDPVLELNIIYGTVFYNNHSTIKDLSQDSQRSQGAAGLAHSRQSVIFLNIWLSKDRSRVEKVFIEGGYPVFLVDIAYEYLPGTPIFNDILKHELTHVAIYRSVAEQYMTSLALEILARIRKMPLQSKGEYLRALQPVVNRYQEMMADDADKRNNLIDGDENYHYQNSQTFAKYRKRPDLNKRRRVCSDQTVECVREERIRKGKQELNRKALDDFYASYHNALKYLWDMRTKEVRLDTFYEYQAKYGKENVKYDPETGTIEYVTFSPRQSGNMREGTPLDSYRNRRQERKERDLGQR